MLEGGYGFAGVRDIFAFVDAYMQSSKWAKVRKEKKREKTHRTSVRVWVGAASECGWTSDLRRSVGWSYVSLSSLRGGGAEGFHSGCFLLELELESLWG
nr:hypothetical protein CFP56_59944 [Quercus suber]